MMLVSLLGASGGLNAPINPIPITAVEDTAVAPANAAAGVILYTAGTLEGEGDATIVGPEWYSPNTVGIGNSYWARLTVNSGTSPSSGTVGSWLALSSTRFWEWVRTINGTTSANVTLEIASDSGGSNVVASRTFSVTAARES